MLESNKIAMLRNKSKRWKSKKNPMQVWRVWRLLTGSAYLLMELTLGTFSWSQTPSCSNRSRISHANMVGFSRLYLHMLSTTLGVATLGLEPPITPGLMEPVS